MVSIQHADIDHTGIPGVGGSSSADHAVCQGRLTLTTAVPVTTSDVTAATTLYFTPFRGNLIGTYDGAAWDVASFTEKSITLASLTAGLPYDVFIVNGTLALELTAWTNATTRVTGLVLQDGVLCKSGTLTRRYLGTITIAATGQCEDSVAKRFVWNYYNRVLRTMQVFDGTDSWSWNTTAWRQARAQTANKVEYVCGVSEDIVQVDVNCGVFTAGSEAGAVGVGIDSTTANSAQIYFEIYGSTNGAVRARYRGWPGIGYHALNWIEYRRAGNMTFIGDNGTVDMQSGLLAEVWA